MTRKSRQIVHVGSNPKNQYKWNLSRFSTTTHRAPSNAHSIASRRPTGPAPTMQTLKITWIFISLMIGKKPLLFSYIIDRFSLQFLRSKCIVQITNYVNGILSTFYAIKYLCFLSFTQFTVCSYTLSDFFPFTIYISVPFLLSNYPFSLSLSLSPSTHCLH